MFGCAQCALAHLQVTSDGFPMEPAITVPPDAVNVTVGTDGTVSVQQAGQEDSSEIGQIQLASFINPAGLESIGRNFYRRTSASGNLAGPIRTLPSAPKRVLWQGQR